MSILDELADYARIRVSNDLEKISLAQMKDSAISLPRGDFRFEKALRKDGLSVICEVKKASPSKGIIAEHFPYLDIAREYEQAGADCMSVLTEPKWFLGSDRIFTEIRAEVNTPMIRKDFTVDEYQLYQARVMGADAVLLICAILDVSQLKDYFEICDSLGLTALVETHDAAEMERACKIGARVIGVNNRNLKDFTVNTENSLSLRELAPSDAVFVSESGIRSAEDIPPLVRAGVDAVLVGEAFMRSENKTEFLNQLRSAK